MEVFMSSCCSVEGCTRPVNARGLCSTHYMVQRRAGLLPIGTRARGTLEERFWRYVLKTEDCWIWTGGSKNQKGYCLIQVGGKGSKHILAHRLSYTIHHGAIPDGMVIMHSCDNPGCVNPAHLKAGTQSENIIEAFNKGRKVCIPPLHFGEKHWSAKLNEELVRYIRVSDKTPTMLSKELGVGRQSIAKAKQRKTWQHIP